MLLGVRSARAVVPSSTTTGMAPMGGWFPVTARVRAAPAVRSWELHAANTGGAQLPWGSSWPGLTWESCSQRASRKPVAFPFLFLFFVCVSFPFFFFFFIFFLFFFFSFSLSCSHSLPAFHMTQLCSLCSSYPPGILFNATHKDSQPFGRGITVSPCPDTLTYVVIVKPCHLYTKIQR